MYARIRTDDFVVHLYGAKVSGGYLVCQEAAAYGDVAAGSYTATTYGKDGKPKASYLVTVDKLEAQKYGTLSLAVIMEL